MTGIARRWALALLGYHDRPDDLEDTVPDDIGISGPLLTHDTFGNKTWYLTATYGTGDDHQHIEIKLDRAKFQQLYDSVIDVAIEGNQGDENPG